MTSADLISCSQKDKISENLVELSERAHLCPTSRSLMHAYIACLDLVDLCFVIHQSLEASTLVRQALRKRIVRITKAQEATFDVSMIVDLVEKNHKKSLQNKKLRKPSDTILSALFKVLPLPSQQIFLERWLDRGTKDSMARWMKAARDTNLFDANVALAYWKESDDWRAAKLLAYEGDLSLLRNVLPELIAKCPEGWIIAKAVMRAGLDDDACWKQIAEHHPATYLYLCASHIKRPVADEEAFELICRCSGSALGGDRGLAIWAVGQMRMVAVLDRVKASLTELEQRDYAALGIH